MRLALLFVFLLAAAFGLFPALGLGWELTIEMRDHWWAFPTAVMSYLIVFGGLAFICCALLLKTANRERP